MTIDEKLEVLKKNVVDYNVVVGVVERMGDSLELIQHVIDYDQEITPELWSLDEDHHRRRRRRLGKNQSHISTGSIVEELKKDRSLD